MIDFSEEFFEGETRDGFYIEPMMKHAWAAQMEVYMEIAEICNRHGIQYFADWGTLLGAVRHHGFVPWDDDMEYRCRNVLSHYIIYRRALHGEKRLQMNI